MANLNYNAYSFRNITGQIWNMSIPVKFIINVYTKEIDVLDLPNSDHQFWYLAHSVVSF